MEIHSICIWYAWEENLSLLLHILVLFKNDASLPVGKKNEQSPEFFTKKKSPDICVVPCWLTTNREPKNLQHSNSEGLIVQGASTPGCHV